MQSCPVHMHANAMPWTAAQQQHLDDDGPVGPCHALPVSVPVSATFSRLLPAPCSHVSAVETSQTMSCHHHILHNPRTTNFLVLFTKYTSFVRN